MTNLLKNGGFEADWEDEESHYCFIIPKSGPPYVTEIGNIHTPPGWTTWFCHDPGTFDQPEVRDARKNLDASRVREGEKAILFFTFGRKHRGGFLQRIEGVTPGNTYRLTAYAHAWSNHKDKSLPLVFPHPHDAKWSEGAGYNVVNWHPDEVPQEDTGNKQEDAKKNFRFCVGIDPYGGVNPDADTVVYGEERHCYNSYTEEPLIVIVKAQATEITVFLRTATHWAFTHNDAYFDSAELIQIAEPLPSELPSERGDPRVQYKRTYVLLSPEMDEPWALAAVSTTWDKERFTVGSSADDAGIGNLDERRVIACNPQDWPGDLKAFYEEYYPFILYLAIEAGTPETLRAALDREFADDDFTLIGEDDIPIEPPPSDDKVLIGLHLQGGAEGIPEFYAATQANVLKAFWLQAGELAENALLVYRWWVADQGPYLYADDKMKSANKWIDNFRSSLIDIANRSPHPVYISGLNEEVPSFDSTKLDHLVRFETAFCDAARAVHPNVRACCFAAAVGNPHESEFKLLLPLARKCEETESLFDYHTYWFANEHETGLESWWPWLAGRWVEMDKVFVANGVRVKWFFGEAGAVGGYVVSGDEVLESFSVPGKQIRIVKRDIIIPSFVPQGEGDTVILFPGSGWKSPDCYGGKWQRYEDDIVEFQKKCKESPAGREGRVVGSVLFTTSGPGWASFEIQREEMEKLERVL